MCFGKISELTKKHLFLFSENFDFHIITKYVFFEVKICIGPPSATKKQIVFMISTQNEKYGYNLSLCEETTKKNSFLHIDEVVKLSKIDFVPIICQWDLDPLLRVDLITAGFFEGKTRFCKCKRS